MKYFVKEKIKSTYTTEGSNDRRRKGTPALSFAASHLPWTVVDLIISPGSTTESSMSVSIVFSFCSMMQAEESTVSSTEEAARFLVSAGGSGALAFGFLLK